MQFAHKLVGEMKDETRLHKEPIKSAGFRVLRAPDVPSVLVELGYVSNKQDLQSLLSDTWRDRTADAIARAVDDYFSAHARRRPHRGKLMFANALLPPGGLSLNKKPSDETIEWTRNHWRAAANTATLAGRRAARRLSPCGPGLLRQGAGRGAAGQSR